jgi:hypothetical protein
VVGVLIFHLHYVMALAIQNSRCHKSIVSVGAQALVLHLGPNSYIRWLNVCIPVILLEFRMLTA